MLNALWIVLLGMAMIFAILGILLLVMYLLGKIPQLREEAEEK
jgi:Na+-transporting methylmalonyl-CoA/oxaloacetate decarboxylase gamma subunit